MQDRNLTFLLDTPSFKLYTGDWDSVSTIVWVKVHNIEVETHC